MQKKILVMSLVSVVTIIGCRKNIIFDSTEKNRRVITVGVVYNAGGTGDNGFNDNIERGIRRAQKELLVKIVKVNSTLDGDYKENIDFLIKQGADLIIMANGNIGGNLYKSAKLFPKKRFVCIDSNIDLPNVHSLIYREEEGSFLVGYLSGLISKTKKVGFIGGVDLPVIEKFYSGYAAGVYMANRNCKLLSEIFLNTFEDMEKGYVAANFLYTKGADIIFQAAGGAGRGVLKSAKEQDKYAIGVDNDQDDLYPGHVLTSVIKRCDIAIFDIIKNLKVGSFKNGLFHYGLREGGIELTDLRHAKKILSYETINKLENMKQAIIKEKIVVPSNRKKLNLFMKR